MITSTFEICSTEGEFDISVQRKSCLITGTRPGLVNLGSRLENSVLNLPNGNSEFGGRAIIIAEEL